MARRAPQPAVAFLSEFQSATRYRMFRLVCMIARYLADSSGAHFSARRFHRQP
jgi:hypothetical protein